MSVHRPRLGRILDDLGSTLFEAVIGRPDPAREVGGVIIYDPYDDNATWHDAVVLGVGVHGPEEVGELLTEAAGEHAAAVVVRLPGELGEQVRAAAESTGVLVLGLTPGASWAQVAALLRALLSVDDVAAPGPFETLAGIPSGDLFTLANAIAALLDGPVTVEDRNTRVLAFSQGQDKADAGRVATVLGRQVPVEYRQALDDLGAFRKIYRSPGPIHVSVPGLMPRVAMAVRAGDEILGSIWVAVREPLSPERESALRDAAKLVALHLLRRRAGADVERRLRTDLLATVLEGGSGASEAALRLGLTTRSTCCVLALALTGDPLTADRVAEEHRIADALALHMAAMHPRTATALLGGVVYAILPSRPGRTDAERSAVRVAEGFIARVGERVPAVVGIGRAAVGAAELPRSRADADRALRALRRGRVEGRVAAYGEVYMESLFADLADRVNDEEIPALDPIVRLRAYDAKNRTRLTETLSAWLDAFGDVNTASLAINVHPNTFRYRMRRLADVGELDLTDPETRFRVMFQLRLGR
ncbi:PucR family transcriptional regulator [Actinomadura rubrisoli]|nr:PucR family transcriptional regulator [Actinomadura rubrisoli]